MLEFLAQDQQNANPLITFLPLILIGGAFYFVLIRPQQKRAKAQQALLRSVEVGDEVLTTAGVYGTIVDIDDETDVITLEIAPGTQIRMVRAGIGRRITEDDEYEDYDEDEDDASDEPQGPIQPS
ncbi:MAG TPA: preprotein translocase subunit YajC [Actinomycetota bacterium]|jgi:preprotein translocase subunit YajC